MTRILPSAQLKIFNRETLPALLDRWRSAGDEIVMTNGCFDILHAGHIQYLEQAAQLGSKLIVAVNEDDSVRRLKGDTRPINTLASRMYLLASLSCVDAVVSFSEDTPLNIILAFKPDILVKGGDYNPTTIVGAAEIEEWGGEVRVLPFVEGFSTTSVERRIIDAHHKTSGAT